MIYLGSYLALCADEVLVRANKCFFVRGRVR